MYLPPDANCLLSVADHCLRSRNYVNLIDAGKQPELQWLDMDSAIKHCTAGAGIWQWASNDQGGEPDVVMACAGDVPTLEILAATSLLRKHVPDIRVRVVNVVDLMTLQPASEHPHGMEEDAFDAIFTTDKPIIFAYHGYPWLIHRLSYRRKNHDNMHVRGYKEEGTTTTPFDMVVLNNMDRYQLAIDAIRRIPRLKMTSDQAIQTFKSKLAEHKIYIRQHGEDMPEVSQLAMGRRPVSWLRRAPATILCVNGGSSSLKIALYRMGSGKSCCFQARQKVLGTEGGSGFVPAIGHSLILRRNSAITVRRMARFFHELRHAGEQYFFGRGSSHCARRAAIDPAPTDHPRR